MFYEKEFQKTNQKDFRTEKETKRKDDKLYVKCKGYNNSFDRSIDKKDIKYMSEYFPKPKSLGANVKVVELDWDLDLFNYATKADFKNVIGVDTLDFAKKKKTDLGNLKSDVDKLGIDQLKNVPSNLSNLKTKVDKLHVKKLVPGPVDLSKLSDVVKVVIVNTKNISNLIG